MFNMQKMVWICELRGGQRGLGMSWVTLKKMENILCFSPPEETQKGKKE